LGDDELARILLAHFPILGWGIGLVLNAWDVFRRGGFTEEQISKEVRHLQGVR